MSPSNKFDLCALNGMKKEKPEEPPMPAGPMKMQPIDRSATMPAPMLPLSPSSSDSEVEQTSRAPTSRAKASPTRTDEVRAAKARITRRNSLLKQRQAQRREPV